VRGRGNFGCFSVENCNYISFDEKQGGNLEKLNGLRVI
jgi:hypothetical protein